MRLSTLLTTAWAGLASSQCSISSIPECAQVCMTNAANSATKCGETDWTCQCTSSNHQIILKNAENCVEAACGGKAQWIETVMPAADAFCGAINDGQTCSVASPSTTTTTLGGGDATATETATGAPLSSTAGADVSGSVGWFAMMVLGMLALV